jgi:hypothetical protein
VTPRRTLAAHRHTSRLARSAAPSRGSRQTGAPVPPSAAASPAVMTSPASDHDEARAGNGGSGRDLETLPADLLHDLQAGRLSQRCPGCGTVEAAGSYCTRCYRPTGAAEWFHQERGRPASGPGKTPRNGINRGPGRPRAHPGGEPVVTDPAAGFWPA